MNEKDGIEGLEQNIRNLKKEEKLYPEQKEHLLELKSSLSKRIELHEKINPIVEEGLELVNPKRKFEENPKYWELQKQLQKMDADANLQKMKKELSSYDDSLEKIDNEIDRIREELPKLEEELKRIKGE